MKILAAQLRAELTVIARNGEQLLVIIGIPAALLIFFSNVNVLPTSGQSAIDFLLPGIIALAVMSTAMVSLGISTGFARSHLVLKRLGATPLGARRLIAAKTIAVAVVEIAVVEIVQCLVLVLIGVALGWKATHLEWLPSVAALTLGTFAFAGIGLTLAGTLTAEVNLAAQNGVYLLLLLFGGVLIPLDSLPAPLRVVGSLLPSGALADVLRHSLTGADLYQNLSWIVLGLWALLAPLCAARWFRWQ